MAGECDIDIPIYPPRFMSPTESHPLMDTSLENTVFDSDWSPSHMSFEKMERLSPAGLGSLSRGRERERRGAEDDVRS